MQAATTIGISYGIAGYGECRIKMVSRVGRFYDLSGSCLDANGENESALSQKWEVLNQASFKREGQPYRWCAATADEIF